MEFWEQIIGPAGYASNYEDVMPTASRRIRNSCQLFDKSLYVGHCPAFSPY